MKFGAFVPQGWRMDLVGVPVEEQWPTMLRVANTIESAGYESLWVYDHFHTVPEPTQEATYECWALMAAFAAATSTVRLGQMCTCNSYRNPAHMAKIASSVDVISGGRLDFAIGAGWYEHEYLAYGYPFPKPSVRIGQLREAVQIITSMWKDEETTFQGEHYTVSGAINQPKSLQDPHPPLWIAGGGPKLTLRVVAEYADYANYAGRIDTYREKGRLLDEHCAAIGRDPSEVVRTTHLEIVVDDDADSFRATAERAASQRGRPVEEWRDGPMTLAGSVDQVVEGLAEFRDEGCGYVIAYFPDAAWGDSLERFAAEVVPALS